MKTLALTDNRDKGNKIYIPLPTRPASKIPFPLLLYQAGTYGASGANGTDLKAKSPA